MKMQFSCCVSPDLGKKSGNYFAHKYHIYVEYMQKCLSYLDLLYLVLCSKPLMLGDVAGSRMFSELQIPPHAATSKEL